MNKLLISALLSASLGVAATSALAADQTVRIAADIPYQPMEYRTPDGTLKGFDIDLGNALCQKAGLKCTWVEQAWDGIIPGLLARKFDAIMSSMTINDDRRKQVLFSDSYMAPPSAWFAPKSAGMTSISKDTLKGKSIGVQRGTLQDNYVTDMYGDTANVRRYATAGDLLVDMDAGRLDTAFLDFPIGKSTMLDAGKGKYEIVGDMITEPKKYFGDGFGIAFRPNGKALAEKFNKALQEVRQDGTYQRIYDEYFAVDKK